MEAPVKGAEGFPVSLAALENQLQSVRQTVVGLIQCLPKDPGRQRPFDDERRIIFLADIFEQAGGKPSVYSNPYVDSENVVDTPFRRFAQQFYSILQADDKREPGGLDQALRLALIVRRGKHSASDS
jgi:hypothetical protein